MAPATGTAILVLAIFVLPGFVTLLLRERSYAIPGEQTPFERLLNALAYSGIVYAGLLLPALVVRVTKADIASFYNGGWSLGAYVVVALLGFGALPALIAQAGLRWHNSKRREAVLRKLGISPAHSTPSGWDQFFGSGQRALVRITTVDGRVVGGLYDADSLAGYSQQNQDLFLEERWELNDSQWFVGPAPGTLGVWVAAQSIVSLELYDIEPAGRGLGENSGETDGPKS
jgi:hypothetical protein